MKDDKELYSLALALTALILFFVHISSTVSSASVEKFSPEPQSNVESKEMSQALVIAGKTIKFDFTKNETCILYVSFDAKKNLGKITTLTEMLKGKSALVPELPAGEVYKSFNVWVGNGGVANQKNIVNSILCFKVDKSWIQNKNIDPASLNLNRYSGNKWEQFSVSKTSEDDKYLYFTAKTPGFSIFAVIGKAKSLPNQGNGNTSDSKLVRQNNDIYNFFGINFGFNKVLQALILVIGTVCLIWIILYRR